mmetsp:Transcript_14529/g.31594  ORF Transcript_14529/g.31594 Transcript_14529/m.31594 type:complete len:127 (+) Transcript_14529:184-564(+)
MHNRHEHLPVVLGEWVLGTHTFTTRCHRAMGASAAGREIVQQSSPRSIALHAVQEEVLDLHASEMDVSCTHGRIGSAGINGDGDRSAKTLMRGAILDEVDSDIAIRLSPDVFYRTIPPVCWVIRSN